MSDDATLLDGLCRRHRAGHPALRTGAHSVSYGALARAVEDAARRLSASGVAPGDRVLLAFPNCPEHVIAFLAVPALGAIAVPLAPRAGAERLAHVIRDTSPRLCVTDRASPAPPALETIRLRLDPATAELACSPPAATGGPLRLPAPALRDPALIRFTSGSTGRPKGVVVTHGQQLWIARTLSGLFGMGGEHRELAIAPMTHSGGWQRVAATLFGGGCVVVSEGPLSVGGILDDVATCGVTGFFTTPPLARALLAASAGRVRSSLVGCRTVEVGSAPLAADELERLLELLPRTRIFVHYGLTECSRAVILDARAHPDKLHTVGRPTPGVELSIRGEDGRCLERDQPGQIFLRGPQGTEAYWRQPELTRERIVGGWLATGDYGALDADGFLTFLGRRDDLIVSGGYSFFPAEVESELGAVPGVAEYLVAGVSDARGVLGQVPWAFVVPIDPAGWSPAGFLALARQRLPAHMVPRRVVVVPRLPLTSSRKPDRRRAVELYVPEE